MLKSFIDTHKRTAKDFLWRSTQILSKQGTAFLIFFLAASFMTPTEFGFYNYLMALMALLVIFCEFGISTSTSKHVAELGRRNKGALKLASTAIITTLILATCVTLLLWLFGTHLGDAFPALLYFVPYLFLLPLSSVLDGVYRGLGQFKELSKITLVSSAISLILAAFIIPKYGFLGAIAAQNLQYLVLSAFLLLSLGLKRMQYDWNIMRKVMGYAAVIGITSIMSFLYTKVDIIVLKQFGFIVEIGYYEIVNKIFTLIILPFFIFGQVIAPKITYEYSRKKYEKVKDGLIKHFWLSLVAGTVISVFLFYSAPIMISFAFSKYFTADTILIFQLLLLTLPLKVAAAAIAQGHTNATGNAHISLWTMIPAGIANLLLDILLISRFGFLGVAYASIICFTFANVSLIYLYNRKLKRMIREGVTQ